MKSFVAGLLLLAASATGAPALTIVNHDAVSHAFTIANFESQADYTLAPGKTLEAPQSVCDVGCAIFLGNSMDGFRARFGDKVSIRNGVVGK